MPAVSSDRKTTLFLIHSTAAACPATELRSNCASIATSTQCELYCYRVHRAGAAFRWACCRDRRELWPSGLYVMALRATKGDENP
jgi:hypothetical protein